jgi:UDP-2,3-diacylglucosamine hydrolase
MIYFISDIHLGFFERERDILRENLLLDFLKKIKHNCEKLYLVGDIFDFWFEYNTVIPKYFYRTLNQFYEFRQSGIEIEFIMGNHDFGHRDFFEKELSIPVFANDIERVHNGKKFYLSHGDGKSDNDIGYKIIKKIMRNKFSLKLYFKLHPDLGIRLASHSSKQSRNYTSSKKWGTKEYMREFAFKKIDAGFDYVVMGHRHRAEESPYKNGKYINLGDWFGSPKTGIFDGEIMNLISISEII